MTKPTMPHSSVIAILRPSGSVSVVGRASSGVVVVASSAAAVARATDSAGGAQRQVCVHPLLTDTGVPALQRQRPGTVNGARPSAGRAGEAIVRAVRTG
jgi:hypothetical protein